MNIYGSSFTVQAYDTNRLIISDIPRFVIFNQPVEFTIDASKAGEGQLEVDINNGLVPNHVRSLGNSKFHFTFLPILNEPHRISIKFNGQQLSGKTINEKKRTGLMKNYFLLGFPKECQVISSDNIRIHGLGLNQVLFNTPTWFIIDTPYGELSDLRVTIVTPSNEQFNPSTLLTSTGLRVDWIPTEIGTYIIYPTIHDKPIPGSPFHVKCYDPKRVVVIPPTNDSSVYKPTKFLSEFKESSSKFFFAFI
jgi:filamin